MKDMFHFMNFSKHKAYKYWKQGDCGFEVCL